ncbi:hypothetical protein EZJ58_1109 [Sodalis ligni]|uniref:Uncharacterized protein n=1 Tax=Sodalis ligni TaxID=2697027 RepID=A0A4V2Q2J0_9GAMM|nr:hypothetical protein EZJ58_1109 [Sodalis ligni]
MEGGKRPLPVTPRAKALSMHLSVRFPNKILVIHEEIYGARRPFSMQTVSKAKTTSGSGRASFLSFPL